MKFGQVKAGQAKLATESFQIGSHSKFTAYARAAIDPEEILVGQLVTTTAAHYINGYTGGQQTDGRAMRHGAGEIIMPLTTTILTSALALFGTDCGQLPEGEYLAQSISSDVMSAYRRYIISGYLYKNSSSDGTILMDWGYDEESVTVTSATSTAITDTSLSMGVNEHTGKYLVMLDGIAGDQEGLIASNTADTFTVSGIDIAPEAGDTAQVVDWQSLTVRMIDTVSGRTGESSTVTGYGPWQRYYSSFYVGTTFNNVHVRFGSSSGTLLVDGAKLEETRRLVSGISTSATATVLTDANRGVEADFYIGREIICQSGDNIGDRQTITDNAQFTYTAPFAATPSATTIYVVSAAAGDCVPTAYEDMSAVSAAFARITAHEIKSGIIRVGGSSRPRLIIDNSSDQAIIVAGDALDADGFSGMKLLRGVGLALYGGSIVARMDQTSSDTGQRMRITHEGIEAYEAENILSWGGYSDGEFTFVMGDSAIQARIEMTKTRGLAAIDNSGAMFWGVHPVNLTWRLGRENIDDYYIKYDTTNGPQMHGGCIVPGTLVVGSLAAAIEARLFDTSTLASSIQAWVHANDATLIDGGNIYTSSIVADSIAADTITGDKLALTSYLAINSSTWGTAGIQIQYNAGAPRMYIGDGSTKYFKYEGGEAYASGAYISGAIVTALAGGTEVAIQGWQTDVVFSSTDLNTVSWASGSIWLLDGTVYSISAGNTGNMSDRTYVYLDIGTSATVLQTTTTASTAVGTGKILVCVAEDDASEATFQVFGGIGGIQINASSIVANSVTANEIAANTITAGQIAAATITTTEIAANTIVAGNIAAATITTTEIAATTIVAGNIAAGTITGDKINLASYLAINSSTWGQAGVQIQYNAAAPRMYIGDGSTKYFKYEAGEVYVSGAKINTLAVGSDLGLQSWLTDIVFSSTDLDTVAWASGSIWTLEGTTYSITGANTGNMSARTYIYLDKGVSVTLLQTSTTISNAIGAGKILIAWAQNTAADGALFGVLGGRGGININAANIIANTITATEIAANTITAAQIYAGTITTTEIAATTIVAGNIAANTITAGQIAASTITATEIAAGTITGDKLSLTSYLSIRNATYGNAGFQVEYIAGPPIKTRLYVGDGANQFFKFDGTNVAWQGTNASLTEAGVLTASNVVITGGTVGGFTLSTTTILVGTGANQAGMSAADTIRFWAGADTPASAPFRVGQSGAVYASNASIAGTITSTAGAIGGFTLAAGSLTAGALVLDSAHQYITLGGVIISDKGGGQVGVEGDLYVADDLTVVDTMSAAQVIAGDVLRINEDPVTGNVDVTDKYFTINFNGTPYYVPCSTTVS